MKTRLKFLMYGVFALAVTITSCEKDGLQGPIGPSGTMGEQGIQGETGPEGPAGEDGEALGVPGPQGETGAAGADGENGTDGDDGANGADGADGNANVETYIYDVSTKSGASIPVTASVLTQNVLDNDLVLGYLKKNGTTYTPIPAPIYAVSLGNNYDIAVELQPNKYWMFFYEVGTENLKSISAGNLDELKLVVIESNNTTSGKSNKEDLLSKMKSAGVNLDDYYSVMDYFGKDY